MPIAVDDQEIRQPEPFDNGANFYRSLKPHLDGDPINGAVDLCLGGNPGAVAAAVFDGNRIFGEKIALTCVEKRPVDAIGKAERTASRPRQQRTCAFRADCKKGEQSPLFDAPAAGL